jgi:ACR3 family arsenite transporter
VTETQTEATGEESKNDRRMEGFERLLTVWVLLCMIAGITLGRLAPGLARSLDGMTLDVGGAPVVSIPIAICLFFMMYPIMVKIDFAEVVAAGKSARPVLLTLIVNWCIKPFTMFAIASFFLGTLFLGFIGPDATDLVKLPFGLDLVEGARYGAGQVVVQDGVKLLEVPLWRSYLAGCILLGVAPCTAMVLVWGYLARGSDGHTLVMVALNSLTMLVLYGVLVVCRYRGRLSCSRSASTSLSLWLPDTSRVDGSSHVEESNGSRRASFISSPRSRLARCS